MKVLYLTNIPSPYRVDFFNELGNLCDLTVLFERKTADNRASNWYETQIKSFEAVFMKGIHIGSESSLNIKVIKDLNKIDYDIIIVGGYSTPTSMLLILYLYFKKKWFILNADGGFKKNENPIKKWVKYCFISKAKYWLCSGCFTKDYLVNYGAANERIYTYPFTSLLRKDILSKKFSYSEKKYLKDTAGFHNKKVVISVGSFIHRKGFDVLINAWDIYSNSSTYVDSVLLIIGGGDQHQQLQNQMLNLGLTNIIIMDFQNKEELKKYYQSSDLMILATREDIWGLVVNEAMANGLPVITTDKCIAGLELIENDVNGFIVAVDDPLELSNKISYILNADSTVDSFTDYSLNKIQEYTIENMALNHYTIFKDILENK